MTLRGRDLPDADVCRKLDRELALSAQERPYTVPTKFAMKRTF